MVTPFRADAIVVGAGVIGLAVARALAIAGREVVVLEAQGGIGRETSSRNSEVIHAGIYYPTASLKAALCVAGRQRLYDYLEERGIAFRRCGKLIVATCEDELQHLEQLVRTGLANGVNDLTLLDGKTAMALEPALRCMAALFSPSTGIIDSHAYMTSLQGDIVNAGGMLFFQTRVVGGLVREGSHCLDIVSGSERACLEAPLLITAAGLQGADLLRRLNGFETAHIPKMFYAKGNYFNFSGRSPFQRLIYPAPNSAGLGIHITFDLQGQIRLGPDVEWVETIDYRVDPSRSQSFYKEIRRYWPSLPDNSITPGYAGIRPKLVPSGSAAADFLVQGPAEHGVPGLINMLGIESPGLTSSLALAELAVAKTM